MHAHRLWELWTAVLVIPNKNVASYNIKFIGIKDTYECHKLNLFYGC